MMDSFYALSEKFFLEFLLGIKMENCKSTEAFFFMKTDAEIQDWADENLPESIPGFYRIENGSECCEGDIFVSIEIDGKRYGKWFRPWK
jgi:hypothetical protein